MKIVIALAMALAIVLPTLAEAGTSCTFVNMVGVTGSIPVAPTIHSSFSPTCGDLPNMPAMGGIFLSDVESQSLENG